MVNDEMVGDACQAAYGPHWSFIDAEAMRRALEAVAAAIRAAALEEASVLVETHVYTVSNVEPLFSLQPSLRAKEDMHHRTIAAAIRAAKETT